MEACELVRSVAQVWTRESSFKHFPGKHLISINPNFSESRMGDVRKEGKRKATPLTKQVESLYL